MNDDHLYCKMYKPHPSVKYQYLTTFKSNILQISNMCNFLLRKIKIILIYWIFQLINTVLYSSKDQKQTSGYCRPFCFLLETISTRIGLKSKYFRWSWQTTMYWHCMPSNVTGEGWRKGEQRLQKTVKANSWYLIWEESDS